MEGSQEDAYALQLFKFLPSDLLEGLKEDLKFCFDDRLQQLEKFLRKVSTDVLPPEELEKGLSQLANHTNENVAKIFNEVQKHLLGNILKVPDHILLPENASQATQHSQEEKDALLDEIAVLEMQLKNEKFVEKQLKEEIQEIESVLKIQEEHIEKVNSHLSNGGLLNLEEKIRFAQNMIEGINLESPESDKLLAKMHNTFPE